MTKRTIFIAMFCLLGGGLAAAQPRVSDVRFETQETAIVVRYNLSADDGDVFKVSLLLRKEDDRAFRYEPLNVEGDVGTGKFIGENRSIVWNVGEEFPKGLEGADYYFEVRAEDVTEGSSLVWMIPAGAVLAGGAVLLIGALSGSEDAPSNPVLGYPAPPGRP